MTHAVKGSDQRTGAWWWIRNIVSWALLLGVLAILLSTVVVPRLTGSTPFTVLTGSMQPTYPPGTLIVVKPQDAAQLQAGDAITYQIESGSPMWLRTESRWCDSTPPVISPSSHKAMQIR